MGLPKLKADDEVLDKSIEILSKQRIVENKRKEKVKKESKQERKIHADTSELESDVETHIVTDREKAELSSEIAKNNKFLSIFTSLTSKITGDNIEKDVQVLQKIAGDEKKLNGLCDKFEKIKNLKDKLNNSFLGKFFGFFGGKVDFDPDDFLNKKGKMKSFGKYIKDKVKSSGVKASISAVFVYGFVRKFRKELELYRPIKRIIETIGGVIERVEDMGAKASTLLKKFKPSREKVYTAQKMSKKAPKILLSFLKNPKKQMGAIVEFLKKGNAVPGFAEKLKESKVKGFKFRGSGQMMVAILSQKMISEIVEEENLANPETFSQRWIPGVALWEREIPNLVSAIKEKGIANSKMEILNFSLQFGFDVMTVSALLPALVAIFSGGGSILYAGGVLALKDAALLGTRKLIGNGMKKYAQKFTTKETRKQLMKQGTKFALITGSPIALNYITTKAIPKINKKVIATVKSQGSVIARQIFSPSQMRAYDMYKGMKV